MWSPMPPISILVDPVDLEGGEKIEKIYDVFFLDRFIAAYHSQAFHFLQHNV